MKEAYCTHLRPPPASEKKFLFAKDCGLFLLTRSLLSTIWYILGFRRGVEVRRKFRVFSDNCQPCMQIDALLSARSLRALGETAGLHLRFYGRWKHGRNAAEARRVDVERCQPTGAPFLCTR